MMQVILSFLTIIFERSLTLVYLEPLLVDAIKIWGQIKDYFVPELRFKLDGF